MAQETSYHGQTGPYPDPGPIEAHMMLDPSGYIYLKQGYPFHYRGSQRFSKPLDSPMAVFRPIPELPAEPIIAPSSPPSKPKHPSSSHSSPASSPRSASRKKSVKWAEDVDSSASDDGEDDSAAAASIAARRAADSSKAYVGPLGVGSDLGITNVRIFRLIVRIQQRFHALKQRAQQRRKARLVMEQVTRQQEWQGKLQGKRPRSKRLSGHEWQRQMKEEDERRMAQQQQHHEGPLHLTHEKTESCIVIESFDNSSNSLTNMLRNNLTATSTTTPATPLSSVSSSSSPADGSINLRMLRIISRIQRTFLALRIRARRRLREKLLMKQVEQERMMQDKLRQAVDKKKSLTRRQTGAEWLASHIEADQRLEEKERQRLERLEIRRLEQQRQEEEYRLKVQTYLDSIAPLSSSSSSSSSSSVSNIRIRSMILRVQRRFHELKLRAQGRLRSKLLHAQLKMDLELSMKLRKGKKKNVASKRDDGGEEEEEDADGVDVLHRRSSSSKRMSGGEWLRSSILADEAKRQRFGNRLIFETHETLQSNIMSETIGNDGNESMTGNKANGGSARSRVLLSPTRESKKGHTPSPSINLVGDIGSGAIDVAANSDGVLNLRTLRLIHRIQHTFLALKQRAQVRIRKKLLTKQIEQEWVMQEKLRHQANKKLRRQTGAEWLAKQIEEDHQREEKKERQRRQVSFNLDPYASKRLSAIESERYPIGTIMNLRLFKVIVRIQKKFHELKLRARQRLRQRLTQGKLEQDRLMEEKLNKVGLKIEKKMVQTKMERRATAPTGMVLYPQTTLPAASSSSSSVPPGVTIANLRTFRLIVRLQRRFHRLRAEARTKLRDRLLATHLDQAAQLKTKLEDEKRRKAGGGENGTDLVDGVDVDAKRRRRITGSEWLRQQLEEAQKTIATLVQTQAQNAAVAPHDHQPPRKIFQTQDMELEYSNMTHVISERLEPLQSSQSSSAAAVVAPHTPHPPQEFSFTSPSNTTTAAATLDSESRPSITTPPTVFIHTPTRGQIRIEEQHGGGGSSSSSSSSQEEWVYHAVDEHGNEFVLQPIPIAEHQARQHAQAQQHTAQAHFRPSPPSSSRHSHTHSRTYSNLSAGSYPSPTSSIGSNSVIGGFVPSPPSSSSLSSPSNPRLVNIKLVASSKLSPRTQRINNNNAVGAATPSTITYQNDGYGPNQPYEHAYHQQHQPHHVPIQHPHYAQITASHGPPPPPPHHYPYGQPPPPPHAYGGYYPPPYPPPYGYAYPPPFPYAPYPYPVPPPPHGYHPTPAPVPQPQPPSHPHSHHRVDALSFDTADDTDDSTASSSHVPHPPIRSSSRPSSSRPRSSAAAVHPPPPPPRTPPFEPKQQVTPPQTHTTIGANVHPGNIAHAPSPPPVRPSTASASRQVDRAPAPSQAPGPVPTPTLAPYLVASEADVDDDVDSGDDDLGGRYDRPPNEGLSGEEFLRQKRLRREYLRWQQTAGAKGQPTPPTATAMTTRKAPLAESEYADDFEADEGEEDANDEAILPSKAIDELSRFLPPYTREEESKENDTSSYDHHPHHDVIVRRRPNSSSSTRSKKHSIPSPSSLYQPLESSPPTAPATTIYPPFQSHYYKSALNSPAALAAAAKAAKYTSAQIHATYARK